ncbi:hypothetical protein [Moorena sp. SIO3B2]|uniref:hypothetical protein n=1 Tax=Moorena sp. SIO3B2 TaxID=2607827 RepID=UPI0013CD0CE7|nr:hypothetical protein [Moorena sp. SIO3B2]NEP35887.1 hypothetical protein [Moorena sp. SIO3B2]
MSRWPDPELTVSARVGIGTDTPSQELEVIGDISARNLNLNGSLTIDENLTVGGNFQLGTLSINTFSSDGNLADNSNLAVPTEQAVKTYVDNQITQVNNAVDTKAALNGAADQDFATNNLTVGGNLQVSGDLEVQGNVIARDTEHIAGNVSLGDEDSDEVKITGVIRSGHSSGALRIDDALHTTGSVSVDGSLSVRDAIATAQLSVTDRVTGSLTIDNNLTVEGTVKATEFVGDGSKLTNLNRWSLAYAHDANGNRTAGNINDLINAVQNGYQVRVLMDSGDVQYITYAENIWVKKNGIVYVQNTSHVSATSDGDVVKFQDDSYWWMIIVSTKGDRDMIRWNVGEHTPRGHNNDTIAMKWFVD